MIQGDARSQRCRRGRRFHRPRGSSHARAGELGITFELHPNVKLLTLLALLVTAKVIGREFHVANGKLLRRCQATSVTEATRVARGLTWMEGWLEGGESVVLEHVQERLGKPSKHAMCDFGKPNELTVFPALSRPRKRIFAFLCRRPVGVWLSNWNHRG